MWILLVAGWLAATQPEFEVQTLDDRTATGTIVEWTADRLVVKTAQGETSLQPRNLLVLAVKQPSHASPAKPGVWVTLVGGSTLVGSQYTAARGRATLTTSSGAIELPTQDVASVRFQPLREATQTQWQKILGDKATSDLLIVNKEDAIDYHQGVLHDVTEDRVELEVDGDTLPVKRTKVFGLVYWHAAGPALATPVCRVSDAAGSCWAATTVSLVDGALRWTTPSGLERKQPVASITRIDFSAGRILYLDEMKPESVEWTPYFGAKQEWPARAAFFGSKLDGIPSAEPLALGSKEYRKGLALRSRSELVYRLANPFRRFQATVGIDDRVRPRGNVRLVIRGDDRVLLETTITGNDPPRPIDLDLAGVRRLAILVDFGEQMDIADHLDLCDARLVR